MDEHDHNGSRDNTALSLYHLVYATAKKQKHTKERGFERGHELVLNAFGDQRRIIPRHNCWSKIEGFETMMTQSDSIFLYGERNTIDPMIKHHH